MSQTVRIYKPSKTAMSSGQVKTKEWVLEPEITSARLPEPLMGWQSSEDTDNQVKLYFSSDQDALKFAQKKGWRAIVQGEKHKKVKPRNYADNFKYESEED